MTVWSLYQHRKAEEVTCWELHLVSLGSFMSLYAGFADELMLSELGSDKAQYKAYKPPYEIGRR